MEVQQLLNFSEPLHDFKIVELKGWMTDILSLHNDKLLASKSDFSEIYIYSLEGVYLRTVNISNKDRLADASWTYRGNIVYTTTDSHKVVVMTERGEVIQYSLMTEPKRLSVTTDGTIYLADITAGVYQSTDDGATWNLVFDSSPSWHCWQVIKVTNEQMDDFWTFDFDQERMRVYSVNKKYPGVNVTWKDINLVATGGKKIKFSYSSMLCDSNSNLFLSDFENKAIHVLTTKGQYRFQLLSSLDINTLPSRISLEDYKRLLLVGRSGGGVKVFRLFYHEGSEKSKY